MSLETTLKRTEHKNELEQLLQLIEFSNKYTIPERNRDIDLVRNALFTIQKEGTPLSESGLSKFSNIARKYA